MKARGIEWNAEQPRDAVPSRQGWGTGLRWLVLGMLVWSGCFLESGDKRRHVSVQAFDITPRTVAVGDTFEVTWKTRHSDLPGDIFKYGLYLAEVDEVEGLEDILQPGDIPRIFKNGGLVDDPGKITCTRTEANKIVCKPFGSLNLTDGARLSGEHTVSFTACVGYVLDRADICESRSTVLTFP
jgi:hypothetical protein